MNQIKKNLLVSSFGFGVLALAFPCRADEAPTPARRWYGDEILIPTAIVSGISFQTCFAELYGNPEALFAVPPLVLASVFTAPIVHWRHGYVGRGFLSFLLHATTGALVGIGSGIAVNNYLKFSPDQAFKYYNPGIVAALAGLTLDTIGMTALEAGFFSYEDESSEKPKRARAPFALSVAPSITPAGIGLGVVGSF